MATTIEALAALQRGTPIRHESWLDNKWLAWRHNGKSSRWLVIRSRPSLDQPTRLDLEDVLQMTDAWVIGHIHDYSVQDIKCCETCTHSERASNLSCNKYNGMLVSPVGVCGDYA